MSEFPFAENESVEDETGSDKKKLVLAGGLAAALVIGGGAFFLTSGGGAEEDAFVLPKRPARVAPAVVPVVKAPAKVPAVFAAPVGRDPFRALYTAPVSSSGGTTPTTVTPVAPVAPAPQQPAPIVITPVKQPTSGGTTAPQQQSQSTIRFKAYDMGTRVGTFVLDGKTTLTGKVNDVLAKKVLVVAMRPAREPGTFFATLKVGDGSQFDAYFGQTVVIP